MMLVLLGPPGAGKGTQAKVLSRELGLEHISTGDILREMIKQDTALGREAKKYVAAGELVPDSLITRMVTQRLSSDDLKDGFILDGFPRNLQQARDLDDFLKSRNSSDYLVLYLEASEETIIQRLSGRRLCRKCQAVFHLVNMPPKKDGHCDFCGTELYQREDDLEATVKNRLAVYEQQTAPVADYYSKQNRLIHIGADREAGIVLREMLKVLNDSHKVKP